MKKIIIGSLCAVFTTVALAESVVNTQTSSWKSVPITVDAEKHTYSTSEGFLLPEGDYYYTYSGYRCLKNKVENAGTEPVEYKDKAAGNTIYCYGDDNNKK
jgi:hypothetical protein